MVGVVGSSPIAPTKALIPATMKTIRVLLLLALVSLGGAALAQFPSRAITVVVPIPPGGAPDIAARVLAEKLSQAFASAAVVENRPGANGNVAAELVAKAAPDGHTLGLLADSQITINPHLYRAMPFD